MGSDAVTPVIGSGGSPSQGRDFSGGQNRRRRGAGEVEGVRSRDEVEHALKRQKKGDVS